MTGPFVIVLTFLMGLAHTQTHTLKCRDMTCVEMLENAGYSSPNLMRMRVWKDGDYAPLVDPNETVWPPLLDLWYQ